MSQEGPSVPVRVPVPRVEREALRPPQEEGPVIQVRGLNAWYGGFRAVKGIDLQVPRNRICLLYTSPSPRDS